MVRWNVKECHLQKPMRMQKLVNTNWKRESKVLKRSAQTRLFVVSFCIVIAKRYKKYASANEVKTIIALL